MKTEINKVISATKAYREIPLFKAMATSLNNYVPAIFIPETHGRRGWVKFNSARTGKTEQKEISDLMIISFNRPTKIFKLAFLQAKYHRHGTNPFLNFLGDYLQLELLQNRPVIQPNSFFKFPINILNFSTYRSLTTYGVFYHDLNNDIDMLYTIADLLIPTGLSIIRGNIEFPGNPGCPKVNCQTTNLLELISTCNIDIFEKGLISFQIGAPILNNSNMEKYLKRLLLHVKSITKTKEVVAYLDSFLTNFINDSNETAFELPEIHPNILILQTNIESKSEDGK
jgi:hypothetical protein